PATGALGEPGTHLRRRAGDRRRRLDGQPHDRRARRDAGGSPSRNRQHQGDGPATGDAEPDAQHARLGAVLDEPEPIAWRLVPEHHRPADHGDDPQRQAARHPARGQHSLLRRRRHRQQRHDRDRRHRRGAGRPLLPGRDRSGVRP
ncbi:hypothetical protein CNY89_23065, partial [Amaricoccus sp. HAR-UPW-R2A-40]